MEPLRDDLQFAFDIVFDESVESQGPSAEAVSVGAAHFVLGPQTDQNYVLLLIFDLPHELSQAVDVKEGRLLFLHILRRREEKLTVPAAEIVLQRKEAEDGHH